MAAEAANLGVIVPAALIPFTSIEPAIELPGLAEPQLASRSDLQGVPLP